jgi:hypothetical protein
MQPLSAQAQQTKRVGMLWNGDETDRGLQLPQDDSAIVRVKLGRF